MPRQTARHKQSRRASRSKAAKKRMRKVRLSLWGGVLIFMLAFLGGGGWWLVDSGVVGQGVTRVSEGFYAMTVEAGFGLEHVTIRGRKKTSKDAVMRALGVKTGESVFGVSVFGIQQRLEGLSAVRSASVMRELPGTFHITLQERSPVAVWQHQGKLRVIDEDGRVLPHEKAADYPGLLLVVGEDASTHAEALLALLNTEPEMGREVVSAVRVGGRRWNLDFGSGVKVMLPETKMQAAWEKLAEMQREQGILSKSVSTIDMRLFERVFIKLNGETSGREQAHNAASET